MNKHVEQKKREKEKERQNKFKNVAKLKNPNHSDEKQDIKLIKEMVKKKDLKK